MKRDDGDSFVFYPTFLEQIEAIRNDRVQLALFKAVVKYGLYGEIPDFSGIDTIGGVLDAVFVPMKYVIDEAKARRKRNIANGLKGGAPKGSRNNPNGRRGNVERTNPQLTETNPNQPTSNLNVNVNGNVNNSTNVEGKKTAKRFSKPSLAQVEEYVKEKGLVMDAAEFYDHYEANGWVRGKTPMKDWQASVRMWARRQPNFTPRQGNTIDAAKQRQAGYADVVRQFLAEDEQLMAENQME